MEIDNHFLQKNRRGEKPFSPATFNAQLAIVLRRINNAANRIPDIPASATKSHAAAEQAHGACQGSAPRRTRPVERVVARQAAERSARSREE